MIPRDIVPGKLRIVRRIGAGGMGVVYEALHLGLERRVAVKVIHPRDAESSDARARFLREARALALLPSEHIVQVLDVDTLPEGDPYMVLEYLEGRDLKRELNKRGRLPVAEAVGYLIQACAGVAAAHSAGIVHRDLKPANIFICNLDGARLVKILDFGLAKFAASQDQSLTGPTGLIGTPMYMAPEQLTGSDAECRSDVWSLGVVLFEILAGRSPFRGDSNERTVSAVLTESPSSLHEERRDVPLLLGRVVARCLEKFPADRFASAGELAAALSPFGPREPIVRLSQRAARGSSAPPLFRVGKELTLRSLDGPSSNSLSATQSPNAIDGPVFVLPEAPLPHATSIVTVDHARRPLQPGLARSDNPGGPSSSQGRQLAPLVGWALLTVAIAACVLLVLRLAESPVGADPRHGPIIALLPAPAPVRTLAAAASADATPVKSPPAEQAAELEASGAARRLPVRVAPPLPGGPTRVSLPRLVPAPKSHWPAAPDPQSPPSEGAAVPLHL
jgi:serine/threonine-protein kinase